MRGATRKFKLDAVKKLIQGEYDHKWEFERASPDELNFMLKVYKLLKSDPESISYEDLARYCQLMEKFKVAVK